MSVTMRKLLCCALLLSGMIARAQSPPSLRPPDQIYIYDFNGDVFGKAPVSQALNLGASYSIEFWMMLNRDAPDSPYIRLFSGASYQLSMDPATRQLSYVQISGTTFRNAQMSVSLVPAQWYHVAIVSDNLQITLYLNGQQQGRFTAAGPPAPAINSSPLILSGQTYGDGTMLCCGFFGSLRQFRVWSRPLQEAEINIYATHSLSGSEAGLIADWPLDDGRGQTLRDVGQNHLALSLTHSTNNWSPLWMRTEIVDGPYLQDQRLSLPSTFPFPNRTIAIDFDSDGKVDLLTCGYFIHTTKKWPCAAFRNDGKGNFTNVTTQVLGANPPSFEAPADSCVADFNGDGRADVFIPNSIDCCGFTGAQNGLLLQTPDGRLEDATATNLPQQLVDTQQVACADIDGDGDVDVYVAILNIAAGGVSPQIYLNDGKGRFTVGEASRLPAILRAVPSQFPNLSAKFIDVNNDGRPALFLGSNSDNHLPHDLLLLNDGRGFFATAPDYAVPTRYGGGNWSTESIKVVDFDGDGWPDLINTVAGAFYAEGAIQILLNNHDGTLRDATERILQPAWPRVAGDYRWLKAVYPADFNGDGFVDLLVEGGNGPPALFVNTGPAGGGRLVEVSDLLPPIAQLADRLAVADFNGDGASDIAGWIGCCSSVELDTLLTSRTFTLPADLIPTVPAGPFFLRGNVLNAADESADALAPGQLVTIHGRNLGAGPAIAFPHSGSFPFELSDTRVLFNDIAAPMIFASTGAVSAVVPFGLIPNTRADVVVEYQGQRSPPVSIFVAGSAPGLFTADGSGRGAARVLNVDSATGALTLNSPQNPAPRGGTIVAYITGAGQTDPPLPDGVVTADPAGIVLPVEAGFLIVGGSGQCASPACTPVPVLSARAAPGNVAGITEVRMRLPSQGPAGNPRLGISVGGIWSQFNATVSIR